MQNTSPDWKLSRTSKLKLHTSSVVYGEVNKPDRYQLNGPTSVAQALALAGSIKVGGNQRTVVIFRRMEDWRMVATQVDFEGSIPWSRHDA